MVCFNVLVVIKSHTLLSTNMEAHTSDIRETLRKKIRHETSNKGSIASVTKQTGHQVDTFEIVVQAPTQELLDHLKNHVLTWFSDIFSQYLDDARKYFSNIQDDEVTISIQVETPLQLLEKEQLQEFSKLTRALKSAQLLEKIQLQKSHETQMQELIARLTQEHEKQRAALSDS